MEVTKTELSRQLGVSPDTVERWIRQGKLPVSRKGLNYRFKANELMKWAAKNNIRIDLAEKKISDKKADTTVTLAGAIRNGGVYSQVSGTDVRSVLQSSIDLMDAVPDANKSSLLDQLIERESALSTGIGNGVAVPHARQPQTYLPNPMVSVCYLSEPVDYHALDNRPVSVLFFILCPDLKVHLKLLSAISYCLKDPSFVSFLSETPPEEDLILKIETLQKNNPV